MPISQEATQSDQSLKELAAQHMAAEQWTAAADAWNRVNAKDSDTRLRHRLCRNLASLQQHRPSVYRAIVDAEPGDHYRLAESRTGAMTILAKVGDREIKLSADNDPLGAVVAVMRGIDSEWKAGHPIGLASIGDGYLLKHLAENPPKLFLDKEHVVVLMESDPRLVLACLTIHDYTGPKGPIEQLRVRWYVGDNWQQQLREDYRNDLMLLHPAITVRLGLNSRQLDEQSKQVLLDIGNWDIAFSQKLNAHTQTLTRDRLVDLFGDSPSRAPRVLVVTTRFSTVLQYSAKDTEQAFREIGWETKLLIEPTPAHGMNRIAIKAAMAEYKPDLIFLIDHHRAEYGDLYPAEIPFVCWVQDNLPNLTSSAAARLLGQRDFALIPSVQRYINQYQYPERQCFEFRKLTKIPSISNNWSSDGDDLVYVSNWSQTKEQLINETIKSLTPMAGEAVARTSVQKVAAVYEQGGSLDSFGAVRRAIGLVMNSPGATAFLSLLFERLNVGLYRQQALSWAAEIAEANGLKLSIYGNGWDKNPQFAKYARGSVQYGPELEELTRRSKINLMLEPYVCIAHQRILDGLAAGGFFLARGNSPTTVLAEVIALTSRPELQSAKSISEVRDMLRSDDQAKFDNLLGHAQNNDATPSQFDIIRSVYDLRSSGFLAHAGEMLPRLNEVLFDTKEQMQTAILKFVKDAPMRSAIVRDQRQQVINCYSYPAGMKRLVSLMRDTIASEPRTSLQTAA